MAEPGNVQLAIERIYLRDVSFESPRAPTVFQQQWTPQVALDINTKANDLGNGLFEVILTVTLDAKVDQTVDGETSKVSALIVELQQAGIFRIEADGDVHDQVLAVACPTILFPYVRETVDSLVSKGSFPPFGLAPVNFEALYTEALQRRNAAASDPTQVQN